MADIVPLTPPPARAGVPPPIAGPGALAEIVRLGLLLADRAVITDIETYGHATRCGDGTKCYDVRPMFDLREQPGEWVDMAHESIAYARTRGLIEWHGDAPHLVRIVRRP